MKTKRRIGDIKPLVTQPMVFRNALLTLQTLGHPAPNQTLYLLVKSFDVQFPDFLVSRLLVDCNHFECQRLLQPRPLGDQIWTSSELLCLCIIFLSCHGTFQINDLTFCILTLRIDLMVHSNLEITNNGRLGTRLVRLGTRLGQLRLFDLLGHRWR